MQVLKVDPEFERLIPPLDPEEFKQLEENIVAEGCLDPLVTWDGTIVDGHNRYKICGEHDIPFQTVDKNFTDRDEVVVWIIKHQFGRRNLNPYQRSDLALVMKPILEKQAKERQKTSTGGSSPQLVQKSAQAGEGQKTRDELAKMAGVSHDIIHKTEVINKEGTPEQKERARIGGPGNSVTAIYNEIRGIVRKPRHPKPEPMIEPENIQSGDADQKADTQADCPPAENNPSESLDPESMGFQNPSSNTTPDRETGPTEVKMNQATANGNEPQNPSHSPPADIASPSVDIHQGESEAACPLELHRRRPEGMSPVERVASRPMPSAEDMRKMSQSIYDDIYNQNKQCTYKLDYLLDELAITADDFFSAIRHKIEEHRDLFTAENRECILDALSPAEDIVENVKEILS